jgi:hypothetical protein
LTFPTSHLIGDIRTVKKVAQPWHYAISYRCFHTSSKTRASPLPTPSPTPEPSVEYKKTPAPTSIVEALFTGTSKHSSQVLERRSESVANYLTRNTMPNTDRTKPAAKDNWSMHGGEGCYSIVCVPSRQMNRPNIIAG